MSLSSTRIRAVIRKEFREYRRNRFIIYTMATLPIFFMALPVIELFNISASSAGSIVRTQVDVTMLLMLVIPVVLPATIAAYSVIGERDQGTLEPLLTTPISREEFLLGKSLAATIPSIGMAYVFFLVLVIAVRLASPSVVVHAVMVRGRGPLRPTAGRVVGLGRYGDLCAVLRCARRATAGHLGQSPRVDPAAPHGPASLQAHRDDRHRARSHARRHRRGCLASGLTHVRS